MKLLILGNMLCIQKGKETTFFYMWFLPKTRVEIGILSWNLMGLVFLIYSSMCISFLLKDTQAYSKRQLLIYRKTGCTHMLCVPQFVHLLVNPGKSCPTLKTPRQLMAWLQGHSMASNSAATVLGFAQIPSRCDLSHIVRITTFLGAFSAH